jgi:ankyrin repeat protein
MTIRPTEIGTFVNNQHHKTAENTHIFGDSDEGDPDFVSNQEKLWNAIESKQKIEVIRDLLMRKDVDSEGKNIFSDGWTALHYAVQESYLEAAQVLIEDFKVNIDSRTNFNKTPFHFACRKGDNALIRYLLDQGANPTVVDRDGYTPLHYLCEIENYEMIKLILPLCK